MSLKHGLLGLLNYNSMTGYDLSKFFSDSLSFFGPQQQVKFIGNLQLWKETVG